MNCCKNNFPPTTKRASLNTDLSSKDKIRRQTIGNLYSVKDAGEEVLTERLKALDHEWDLDRVIESKSACMILLSSILGIKSNKLWFLITGVLGVSLIQYALKGWCMSLPILRGLGIRTAEEINYERTVLRMLRNDFNSDSKDIIELLNIAERL